MADIRSGVVGWRMRGVKGFTRRLVRDERGLSSIEYGFIAALIAVGIIISVGTIGASLTARLAVLGARMAEVTGGG
jgi:Flp pilus assembly pilin Flp